MVQSNNYPFYYHNNHNQLIISLYRDKCKKLLPTFSAFHESLAFTTNTVLEPRGNHPSACSGKPINKYVHKKLNKASEVPCLN